MKIALDSNRYTDFCRGVSEVVEVIENATEIYLPLIVLATESRLCLRIPSGKRTNEC